MIQGFLVRIPRHSNSRNQSVKDREIEYLLSMNPYNSLHEIWFMLTFNKGVTNKWDKFRRLYFLFPFPYHTLCSFPRIHRSNQTFSITLSTNRFYLSNFLFMRSTTSTSIRSMGGTYAAKAVFIFLYKASANASKSRKFNSCRGCESSNCVNLQLKMSFGRIYQLGFVHVVITVTSLPYSVP
jgi:hypothetical protein